MSQINKIHSKVFSGSFFMMMSRFVVKSIGLVSSIILARLLVPEDFGLVAIAMALYAFIELFGSFGFGTMLIQKTQATENDYNTAWTLKFIFGLAAACLLFALAPLIADFYQEPQLNNVVRAISFLAFLSGCTNIGVIDFQKTLDFRSELKLQVFPKIISFCFTMILAFYLRNFWALVFGMIINELLNVIFSYRMSSFRPKFSFSSTNELFGFSKWLIFNNFIDFINRKVPILIAGHMLDSKSVGFFTVGDEVASLPTTEIAAPVNRATYPVYAKLKDNIGDLAVAYLNTVSVSTFMSLPAAAGISVVAPVLVPVVLGTQWAPMIEMMQLLAMSGFLLGISSNVGYVFLALGNPSYLVKVNLIKGLIFIWLLIIFVPFWGVTGIGAAAIPTSVVLLIYTQYSLVNKLNIRFSSIIKSCYRPLIGSAIMILIVRTSLELQNFELSVFCLLFSVLLGVISYSFTIIMLWLLAGKPDGVEAIFVKKARTLLRKER